MKTGRRPDPSMKRAVESMLARGVNCTEGQACEAVAKHLRKKVVPEWLWSELRPLHEDLWNRPGGPSELLSAFKALCRDASGRLYCHRQTGYRGRRRDIPKEVQLDGLIDPREIKRAQILSAELGRLASSPSAVRYGKLTVAEFRKRYLDGRSLDDAEAYELLNSDAPRYVDWSKVRNLGIPIVGFACRVVEDRNRVHEHNHTTWRRIMFDITWNGKWHRCGVEYPLYRDDWLFLRFPDEAGDISSVMVRPGSALDELRGLSVALAAAYLWDESDAVWFVLTGRVPEIPCLSTQLEGGWRADHTQVRIVLTIQPWVSAKTVMRVYRKAQVDLLRKENRYPKTRSLDLLAFVAPRKAAGTPWRTILKEWNEARPKVDRYGRDGVRNVQRDFEAIYRLVTHPIDWLRDG